MPSFTLTINGNWLLKAEEMWPDGVPEGADSAAAIELVRAEVERLGIHRFINEWNLDSDFIVSVDHTIVSPRWAVR